MDINIQSYRYVDDDGHRCYVPIERVCSVSQCHKGDHITIEMGKGSFWHHAIVKDVDTEKNIIHVLEYFNCVKEFLEDNFGCRKNPGIAKVRRGKYTGSEDGLYLIKHKKCLPADTVISNAMERLGENRYHLLKNNCEHFAMWCKTGISLSQQVKDGCEMVLRETAKSAVASGATHIASRRGEKIKKTSAETDIKQVDTQTASKDGQEIMETSAETDIKQVDTQTASKDGQGIMETSAETTLKAINQTTSVERLMVSQDALQSGQDMKSGTLETTLKAVNQTTSAECLMLFQDVLQSGQHMKSGTSETTSFKCLIKPLDVLKSEQGIMKSGALETKLKAVNQTTTSDERPMVSQDVLQSGQDMKSGALETKLKAVNQTTTSDERPMVSQDVLQSGQDMKSGALETKLKAVNQTTTSDERPVVSQDVSQSGQVMNIGTLVRLGPVACFVLYMACAEIAIALYDLRRLREDLNAGKISPKQYENAKGKRIVAGVSSFVGCCLGAVVGQALIPIPIVGALASLVGALVGGFCGNKCWDKVNSL